jgi:hypothetical protein
MTSRSPKIDSNAITIPDYTDTHYKVADALGAHLPAPEGSAVYVASVIRNEDGSHYGVTLGYYVSEEAALAAIANDALAELDDYGLSFPWDNESDENYDNVIYWTADAIEARRNIWLDSRSCKQIAESLYEFPTNAEVVKVVVSGTPKIG